MADSTVNQGDQIATERVILGEALARWEAARHVALESGRRVHVYPGSGHLVGLSELGPEVMCVGSNCGLAASEEEERIDIVDSAGNYASAHASELLVSDVLRRLDPTAVRFLPFSLGAAPETAS